MEPVSATVVLLRLLKFLTTFCPNMTKTPKNPNTDLHFQHKNIQSESITKGILLGTGGDELPQQFFQDILTISHHFPPKNGMFTAIFHVFKFARPRLLGSKHMPRSRGHFLSRNICSLVISTVSCAIVISKAVC